MNFSVDLNNKSRYINKMKNKLKKKIELLRDSSISCIMKNGDEIEYYGRKGEVFEGMFRREFGLLCWICKSDKYGKMIINKGDIRVINDKI